MCQSKSQGGRRCSGRGDGGGTATLSRPVEKADPQVKAGTPSREDTDRLAANLPDSRRGWDGSPLAEKDKRFFALRDSGYKGPIDQDGYPDTTSRDADTLRYMARQRGESVDW
jgi:hypothetical protein